MVELDYKQLKWDCNIKSDSSCTLDKVVLQDRFINSFEIGMNIEGRHIFVNNCLVESDDLIASLIKRFDNRPVPGDIVCVNNFNNPNTPMIISLPRGYARKLEKDMREFKKEILRADEDIEDEVKKDLGKEFSKLERLALKSKLKIEMGDDPLSYNYSSTVQINSSEENEVFKHNTNQFQEKFTNQFIRTVVKQKLKGKEWEDYLQDVFKKRIIGCVDELKEKYSCVDRLGKYFDALKSYLFEEKLQLEDDKKASPSELLVNVLVDNSKLKKAPVIFESNPSHENVIGKLQEKFRIGQSSDNTEFLKLIAGSLIKANGGYLVIDLEDLLSDATTEFNALKNALFNGKVKISNTASSILSGSIDTEEVEIDTKVILKGNSHLYRRLCNYDSTFKELFKTHADFDSTVENVPKNQKKYSAYVKTFAKDKGLLKVEDSAACALVEHASRIAEDKRKLSTDVDVLTDILEDASAAAKKKGRKTLIRADIQTAIADDFTRKTLVYTKEQEWIDQVSLIEISGSKIGVANGLLITDLGDVEIGAPQRISTMIGVGKEGIVHPDVEAEFAGPILKKSTHIIEGYLLGKYCKDKPLLLSAKVTFEQNYNDTDGDSASLIELLTVLSALSGMPIKQNIPVTGSVDQFGNVQPIGGVNYKVAGFYDTCKLKGKGTLTGDQGVMIPEKNVDNLMLRPDIVNANKGKKFHVYTAKTVDEAINTLFDGADAEKVHNLASAEIYRLCNAYAKFGKDKRD